MISASDFDGLIELGRRQGGLDIDDIRQALPVDSMTVEELADLVVRLEEAGVAVEIDPLLFARHREAASVPGRASPVTRSPDAVKFPTPSASTQGLSVTSDTARVDEAAHTPLVPGRSDFPIGAFIYAMAGAVVVFLLAWALWR